MINFQKKKVLITGGSSGIGLALARHLAKLGANIWILGRNPEKLDSARGQIAQLCLDADQQVQTIQVDVADQIELDQALAGLLAHQGAPDLLINSAGITQPGLFESLDMSYHRENMEINYFGTLYAIKAVLPGMIKRRSGYIVNISSLAGLHGLYGYSAYCPSKFALKGLSDSLRYELKPYGIKVSIAFPTDTETPQLEYETKYKPPVLKALTEGNNTPVSAESVAEKILRSVQKEKYLIFPTTDGRILFTINNLLPGELLYWFVDRLMVQARRKASKDLPRK